MRSQIGRTVVLCVSISCVLALWASPHLIQDALAQTDGLQARLDRCLAVENDDKRLRCFEIVARGGKPDPALAAAPRSSSATASSSPQTATGPEDGDQGESVRELALNGGTEERREASKEVTAEGSDEDRFGLPEKREPRVAEDKRILTVSKVRQSRRGGWLFLMENGQIWRQTDGLTIPEPASGDRADIEKGFLGGFLMRINSRTIRVKREK